MTRDQILHLYEVAPHLFPAPPRNSIECGEGWYSPILSFCEEAEKACVALGITLQVEQIKEKLGGLRIYFVNRAPPEIQVLLEEAEGRCAAICETCGDHGKPSSAGGWLAVRCDKCQAAALERAAAFDKRMR